MTMPNGSAIAQLCKTLTDSGIEEEKERKKNIVNPCFLNVEREWGSMAGRVLQYIVCRQELVYLYKDSCSVYD